MDFWYISEWNLERVSEKISAWTPVETFRDAFERIPKGISEGTQRKFVKTTKNDFLYKFLEKYLKKLFMKPLGELLKEFIGIFSKEFLDKPVINLMYEFMKKFLRNI